VKVITCVAGVVRPSLSFLFPTHYALQVATNFHENQVPESYSLPSGSRYQSMEPAIRAQVKGGSLGNALSASTFAEEMVKDVLGGRTCNTYRGDLAWVAPYIPLLPQRFRVSPPSPSNLSH